MNKINSQDNTKAAGNFTVRKHKSGEIKWQRDDNGNAVADQSSMRKAILSPLEAIHVFNKVVSSAGGYGRNLIIRQFMGDYTYGTGLVIDSAKIGTGNTAPADADTDLQTPILTITPVALYEVTDHDTILISWFIPDEDLANGTYKEFGMFISNRLFNRGIISPNYNKGTNEDTTVEYEVSLT